jgi:hypothetical protein
VEPTLAKNYRAFICDWKRKAFGDAGSDSRMIGIHLAHFRYHLFRYLARFFSEPGREPYIDIVIGGQVI